MNVIPYKVSMLSNLLSELLGNKLHCTVVLYITVYYLFQPRGGSAKVDIVFSPKCRIPQFTEEVGRVFMLYVKKVLYIFLTFQTKLKNSIFVISCMTILNLLFR